MAELWKNLIAQEDPALAEALELSRVSISKKTGAMRVRLRCDRILNDAQFECVNRRIAGAFPAVGVKVQLEYPALRQRVLEECEWKLLSEAVALYCGGKLTVHGSRVLVRA